MIYMVWMKMVASVYWFFQIIILLGTRVALRPRYSIFKMERINYVDMLVNQSYATCVKKLRVNMRTFHKLCYTLESRGYTRDNKYMNVVEQVAILLYFLNHLTFILLYLYLMLLCIIFMRMFYQLTGRYCYKFVWKSESMSTSGSSAKVLVCSEYHLYTLLSQCVSLVFLSSGIDQINLYFLRKCLVIWNQRIHL